MYVFSPCVRTFFACAPESGRGCCRLALSSRIVVLSRVVVWCCRLVSHCRLVLCGRLAVSFRNVVSWWCSLSLVALGLGLPKGPWNGLPGRLV